MILAALLLLAAGDALPAARAHDGGVCAGLSWIALAPGETAFVEQGPDFVVLRFEGPKGSSDRSWGVYSGGFAQVRGNGAILLTRDGVDVRRAEDGGAFRGYIAQKGYSQNHFFGSVLSGTKSDRAFFDRVDFGPAGQALCAKG